jgi:hypothetical protein
MMEIRQKTISVLSCYQDSQIEIPAEHHYVVSAGLMPNQFEDASSGCLGINR